MWRPVTPFPLRLSNLLHPYSSAFDSNSHKNWGRDRALFSSFYLSIFYCLSCQRSRGVPEPTR